MKENKIKIIMILTIVSILLVFTGITYAYFTAFNNEGSTVEISFGPGKMLIEYADKSDALSLTKTNIQPSDTVLIDKTFTLTGINTASADSGITMPFTISLEYQNTFENYELYYFFKRTDENENIIVSIVDMTGHGPITKEMVNSDSALDETFIGSYLGVISDWSNETHTQEIANGYFKPNSEKQTVTFNLRMMFPDFESNQDYNKGATFNGKIVINSSKAQVPQPAPSITGQTANYLAKLDKNENSLKIDDTADSNLRYTGNNPNNYVSFNNELWRIVGNFNVYNAETNQNEVLTKIVSNDSIGSTEWDKNNIGSWNQATLMKSLNKEYINTINESSKMIAKVRWNLGEVEYIPKSGPSSNNNFSALNVYNAERGTNHVTNPDDGVERQDYWDGKIGLPYLSDTGYSYNDDGNWLSSNFWTLTSVYQNNNSAVYDGTGTIVMVSTTKKVIPSIYLKSDVKIESGTGTTDDPYILTYEGNSFETPSSNKISDYIASLDKSIEGLEIDDTKDKNLRYVGENPYNYIGFNQELWQIIGTFNVYNTETKQNEVLTKIIRRNSLGSYSWDTSDSSINNGNGINEWSQSKLMTELNTDYLDTSKTFDDETTWYNDSNNSKNATYEYRQNIKSGYLDKIATVRWNLGGVDLPIAEESSNNNTKAISTSFLTYLEENTSKKTYETRLLFGKPDYSEFNLYNAERGTNHVINPTDGVERKDYWDGKVGLVYPSDFYYASDWIGFNYQHSWTITSNINSPFQVIATHGSYWNSLDYEVHPVIYLKSDVTITGGIGTSSSPYLIDGDVFVQ